MLLLQAGLLLPVLPGMLLQANLAVLRTVAVAVLRVPEVLVGKKYVHKQTIKAGDDPAFNVKIYYP